MKIRDANFINLYWSDENEYFMTDATLLVVEECIKETQKIDDYNADDLYLLLRKKGFEVEGLSFEQIYF